ncbi:TetR/AcrR family transcriptional regulator [Actinoplanes sp. TBRC 11911]|uniref:TetR/AcrR family transcriptional regulator n=1 Tax=Actinoplanes sp. TBRC 11911 TaxID=2729386 RepID=UPI00145F7BC9|nr:TetR/AcrR family transcriptional regulator [Actinoplanes sp. TBRC 11911]NMO51798.1 TetR/AcrR family transcriptional regulator [Actinoplanes sp. TBRC 11911]
MASTTRRRSAQVGRPTTAEAGILAATRRLLVNGASFTEMGVQEICAEAGVARSTFYSHFRDKIDLILRLTTDLTGSAFETTTAWEPADGLDRLAETFENVLRIYRDQAPLRRAITEVATYDVSVREVWANELKQFTDRTIEMIRTEQKAGRAPATIDAVAVTRVVVVGGEQAIVDQATAGDPADDAVFARELAETWWYGVFRRPPG